MYEFEVLNYRDPRDIDWTDALDPRTASYRTERRSQARYSVFSDPDMIALRMAGNYEPYVRVVPDGADALVQANSTYEELFNVPPGSYLLGFNGDISFSGPSFKFQVKDLGSGQVLLNQASYMLLFSPLTPGDKGPLYLDKPLCLATGKLAVQVTNNLPNAQKIQFALWLAIPSTEADRIKNPYDAQLEQIAQRSLSTPRALAGIDGDQSEDYRTMPKTGRPFLYLKTIAAPLNGNTATIASFTVPPQTRAAITHIRHYFTGQGFNDGDPGLVWSVVVDKNIISPGFEAMSTQMGRAAWEPLAGPMTARPGQLVEYKVLVSADVQGTITAGLQGYLYPAI